MDLEIPIEFVAAPASNIRVIGSITICGHTGMIVRLRYLRRVWIVEAGLNTGTASAAGVLIGTINISFIRTRDTFRMNSVGLVLEP